MKIHSYGVNMTVEDGTAVAALGEVLAVDVGEFQACCETRGDLFVVPFSDVQNMPLSRFGKWCRRDPERSSHIRNSPLIDELDF